MQGTEERIVDAGIAEPRPLSQGELALARGIFGDALLYDRVRIHARKAYFFQPRDCAMAPDGHVYFPPACHRDDFSTEVGHAAWLIHELTHVWQHQQGMWLRLRACLSRRYGYGDLARRARPFRRYGIEQQAAIVEDAFLLRSGRAPRHGCGTQADYARVMPFGKAATRGG